MSEGDTKPPKGPVVVSIALRCPSKQFH
jgi:hypothetical protein